jgi:hypothetical protein
LVENFHIKLTLIKTHIPHKKIGKKKALHIQISRNYKTVIGGKQQRHKINILPLFIWRPTNSSRSFLASPSSSIQLCGGQIGERPLIAEEGLKF